MIYSPSVTVPKGTTQATATIVRVPITLGLLYQFRLYFPPGCASLVHVVLMDGAHQVYPSNETQDFAGDGAPISFDDLYVKENNPSELQILAWNTDDTFQHTITMQFAILPRDAFALRFAPSTSSDQLSQIIALLAASQGRSNPAAVDSLLNTFGNK